MEGIHHEAALARSGHAGDTGHEADGEVHIDVLEVVAADLPERESAGRRPARPRPRRAGIGQIRPGPGSGAPAYVVHAPGGEDFSARGAGARAHVDDVIRRHDHVPVVFHHQHRVARVLEPPQDAEKPRGVPRVEPHGGFVEHVDHP